MTTPRTVDTFIEHVEGLIDVSDFEHFFHMRESARFHVADGRSRGLNQQQLMPRCQHLTHVIPKGVIGCYQLALFEAMKADWIANDGTFQAVSNMWILPLKTALATGTGISFGREAEIAAWIITQRYNFTDFDAQLRTYVDTLTGAVMTWRSGSGMISSNAEEIRMIRNRETYMIDFDEILHIHHVIPSDSADATVLFDLDTTASYRIKSATMFGSKLNSQGEPTHIVRDVPVSEFTGNGSVYSLTYGVWTTHMNALTTPDVNDPRPTFSHMSIEFELNPSA